MFQWFNPRTFLDTCQEWHALVEGFSEVLCPWPERHPPSAELATAIRSEHHYYMWGRALGILAWLAIGCVIKATLF